MTVNKMHPFAPVEVLKIPPHSTEAEQCVIGSILLTNEAFDRVTDLINADSFYNREHQDIYRCITDMLTSNKHVDLITLSEFMESTNVADGGVFKYLGELSKNTPSVSQCRAYAEIIKERYALRQIAEVAHSLSDRVYNTEGKTALEMLADAEESNGKISALFQDTKADHSIGNALNATIDHIERRMKNPGLDGVSTGFKWLDRYTNGLKPSNLIILAARPAMGKTTFGLNILENHALAGGRPYLFSLEMSKEECTMKHISSLTGIDLERIQNPSGIEEKNSEGELEFTVEPLSDHDWARISGEMQKLKESNLHINDDAYQTVPKMRLALREYSRKVGKPTLIMVDYLQLVSDPKSSTRFDEISSISRQLKALCKEFKCPLIAVSQLSRKLEDRTDKRPQNADLRESGQIEQDANVIMFVFREEVYKKDDNKLKGLAEIIITKQRMGKIGTVDLGFQGNRSRFVELHESVEIPRKNLKKHQRPVKGLDLDD